MINKRSYSSTHEEPKHGGNDEKRGKKTVGHAAVHNDMHFSAAGISVSGRRDD